MGKANHLKPTHRRDPQHHQEEQMENDVIMPRCTQARSS
jgi:hypothetical protein